MGIEALRKRSNFLWTALTYLLVFLLVFHMRKKSSANMLFFVLSPRFLPFAAILAPLFVIFTRLNLLDNLFALIIVYTAMNLPLLIWMARSYFIDLPKE